MPEETVERVLNNLKVADHPPYNTRPGWMVLRILTDLIRDRIHNRLVTAIQKEIPRREGLGNRERRTAAYNIVLKLLGIPDGYVNVSMRTSGENARVQFITSMGTAKSFNAFLRDHAPSLVSDEMRATIPSLEPSLSRADTQEQALQRSDSTAVRPPAVVVPAPLGETHGDTATTDVKVVVDVIKRILQPQVHKFVADRSIPEPYHSELCEVLQDLRAPVLQEVGVVLLGHNDAGKSTAADAVLQSTEVTSAEYAANRARCDLSEPTKAEWDILYQELGAESAKLLSNEQLFSELRRLLGYSEDTSPDVWRVQIKMPVSLASNASNESFPLVPIFAYLAEGYEHRPLLPSYGSVH